MKFKTVIAAAGMAMLSCGSALAATSTTGVNGGLVSGLGNSAWFFNFTGSSNHHRALDSFGGSPIAGIGKDAKVTPPGSLFFENPVFSNPATPAANLGLQVSGFKNFSIDGQGNVSGNTPHTLVHDFWSGRPENGIGVMSSPEEGTPPSSSLEQVNHAAGEYLLLEFTETIDLLGLDFSSGEHRSCDGRDCGGVNIYTGASGIFSLAHSITGNMADAVNLTALGISGDTFILEAIGPTPLTVGEEGWYLGAVAGNVSAVPLPASFVFLLLGLVSLGAIRLRSKTST